MVKRYPGGIISPLPPTITSTSASGFFGTSQSAQYNATSTWPGTGPQSPPTIDYILIAGGGAGGGETTGAGTGGGGGGGYVANTAYSVTPIITYTITIGAGGTGTTGVSSGANSTIVSLNGNILAYGGGGGGTQQGNGASGGSGGGSGYASGAHLGGKGVYPGSTYIDAPRQGFDGGNVTSLVSPIAQANW